VVASMYALNKKISLNVRTVVQERPRFLDSGGVTNSSGRASKASPENEIQNPKTAHESIHLCCITLNADAVHLQKGSETSL